MIFRKTTVSKECMDWLEKSGSFDVKPEEAKSKFDRKCSEIGREVLQAIMTEPECPSSADGKVEVVVDIRLVKAEKLNVMMVDTKVYAVVYTNKRRKYYLRLDENRQLEKVKRIGDQLEIHINGGDYIEPLRTIESKKYRISM